VEAADVQPAAAAQLDEKVREAQARKRVRELDEYQLDPVVRAPRMPRVNLLVADDVGVGRRFRRGSSARS